MPTYEYECDACGHAFEKIQRMVDPAVRKCPKCAKLKVRRIISGGSGVIFKGSGFYETDYKRKRPGGGDRGGDARGGSEDAGGGEKGEESSKDKAPSKDESGAKPDDSKSSGKKSSDSKDSAARPAHGDASKRTPSEPKPGKKDSAKKP